MRYLTKEELYINQKAKDRLGNFSGPAVKFGFSIELFNRYAKKYFTGWAIKILDCGVAGGGFIKDLYQAGYRNLYGVDLDNYLTPEVAKLFTEFKDADLSFDKVTWPDGFFDILTAWCLIPHLENPHNFIREAYRLLQPNGLLIFSTVNITSRPNRRYFLHHRDFPGYHENNNHISLLTPAIFQKTILRYFELIGQEYFINPRVFTGLRGGLRKITYDLSGKLPSVRHWLNERWGPKIVYILKKRPTTI